MSEREESPHRAGHMDTPPIARRWPAHATENMAFRRLVAVLLLLLGMLSVAVRASNYREPLGGSNDFVISYAAARNLIHGRSPYEPTKLMVAREFNLTVEQAAHYAKQPNWQPPFRIILTVPFALLPFTVAGIVWLILCAGSIIAAAATFAAMRGWSPGAGAIVGVGVLALPIVQSDLAWGQINGPMLLLVVLAWRFLIQGRDRPAGLLLGAAAAFKFYPLLLAVPVFRKRRYRPLLIGAITAGFLNAGLLVMDASRYFRAAAAVRDAYLSANFNVSWTGLTTRLLPNSAGQVLAFLGVSIGVLLLWRSNYWMAAPLVLLVWPIVWDHYLLLLLPWLVLELAELQGIRRLIFATASLLCVVGVPRVPQGALIPTAGMIIALVAALSSHRQSRPTPEHWS
jgi:hypothetical protein